MKFFSLFFMFLILQSPVLGQRVKQTIRGQVVDKDTKIPLIGATISLLETEPIIGTITDENGSFVLEQVPIGRYDIAISYIGYSTYIENAVLVNSLDDVILEIGLAESSSDMGEIIVSSDTRATTNEAGVVSARSFNLEELNRIPGGIDDPARMVRKFPGITPNPQITNNEINVRGNNSRAVRWRLDEVDIYNPNHYGSLGGSGGTLTIFSQRLLTNTDFYSGAFPADYGDAIGGVFDVRFRNGNTEKRQHSVQLSLLGVDLATEGPMDRNGKSSYIANYRLSSTFLLDQFLNLGTLPVFQDLSFKFHIKLPHDAVLNIFGIGGINSLSSTPQLDTAQNINLSGGIASNRTGTFGLSYLQPHSNKTYSKHTLLATGINAQQASYYYNLNGGNDTIRSINDDDWRFSYATYVNHKFSRNHTHRSGLMIHGLYTKVFNVQLSSYNAQYAPSTMDDTVRLGEDFSMLMQAYSRSQFYVGKWQFNVGFHFMYLLYNNAYSIEPRFGVKYKIHPRHTLSFGYGIHSQMEPFFVNVSKQYSTTQGRYIQKNRDVGFNKAQHFVLAYQTEPIDKLRLGVELYYQYHYEMVVGVNNPISRVGASNFLFETFDLNNGGTGHNYGLEIALEKAFAKSYYILFNASLFEANYIANDGIRRSSAFNAQYIFNLVGGKEFRIGKKKATFLSLNLSTTYSGPQYYTEVDRAASLQAGYFVPNYSNPSTKRAAPLLLMDFSLVIKFNGKKTNSQLTLQVNNVLNQTPITQQVLNLETGEVDYLYGTGIIPIIGWRISF